MAAKQAYALMLDKAVAHLGAVGCDAHFDKIKINTQFLVQPSPGAGGSVLTPVGVGATGIRPQPAAMIFASRPALDQHRLAIEDKDRDRIVQQAATMRLQLVDRITPPVGGDRRDGAPVIGRINSQATLILRWSAHCDQISDKARIR